MRLAEVRPDLIALPVTRNHELSALTLQISTLKKEPCGEDVPVVLFQRGTKAPRDIKALLQKVGASAFLPWPPRHDVISKAVDVLTQEDSTDSQMSLPVIEEEATAEITINQAEDNFIDPILFAAAGGLDEDDDEMPTNPRQPLAELNELEMKVEVQPTKEDVVEQTAACVGQDIGRKTV